MNDNNLSKNVKSAALISLVIIVGLVAIINSSTVVPWLITGFIILAVGLPLQRSEKFANLRKQIMKTINGIRRWNDLNEREKFYRSLWWAFPTTIVVLVISKNPFFAGATLIVSIWGSMRYWRKWQRVQDEEKP